MPDKDHPRGSPPDRSLLVQAAQNPLSLRQQLNAAMERAADDIAAARRNLRLAAHNLRAASRLVEEAEMTRNRALATQAMLRRERAERAEAERDQAPQGPCDPGNAAGP